MDLTQILIGALSFLVMLTSGLVAFFFKDLKSEFTKLETTLNKINVTIGKLGVTAENHANDIAYLKKIVEEHNSKLTKLITIQETCPGRIRITKE